jgi:hypothetical protein
MVRPPFDSLALEAKCLDRVRSRSAQDLSTSDSDLIPSGWRQGPSLGPTSKAIHTDLTGGQLGRSLQVTRVIGFFDPHRQPHQRTVPTTANLWAITLNLEA